MPSTRPTRRLRAAAAASLLAALTPALAGTATSHAPADALEPQRVITLEFLQTEIALTLELPVVGTAGIEAYRRWVGVETEALADASDVGGRSEPSLERILRLQPDLIVSSTWRHGGVAERLSQIAPLLLYRDLPRPEVTDQYTRMQAMVRDLGARTGREGRARELLGRLEQRLAAGRERLARAGHRGTAVVYGHPVPGNDRIRLFTGNSIAVQILQRLGLANGWDAPDGEYGYRTVGIEDLQRLHADAHLILVAEPDRARFEQLTRNPAWSELAPVRDGRFHAIDRAVWPFGGPVSAMRLADALVSALTAPAGEDGR